jgi:hypothetical protein
MWQVAPMSSNQEYLQEVNEFFEQTLLYANIAMRNKKLSRFKRCIFMFLLSMLGFGILP